MQEKTSTKEHIFRQSIHLFADCGYESTSMKMIAKSSGIQPASIYNHYPTKEALLESIYQYFGLHQHDCRPTEEEYTPILKKGTATDIINIFNYTMSDYHDPEMLMFHIIRILYSRIHIDTAAREVYRIYSIESSFQYINEVLRKGIELNRIIMKTEDMTTFASLLLASRVFIASSIPLYPDADKMRKDETDMMHMLADILKLNPPIE